MIEKYCTIEYNLSFDFKKTVWIFFFLNAKLQNRKTRVQQSLWLRAITKTHAYKNNEAANTSQGRD